MVVNSITARRVLSLVNVLKCEDARHTRSVQLLAFVLLMPLWCFVITPRIAFAAPGNAPRLAAAGNEDPFKSVKACQGKTADQALKAARDAGIDADFEDSAGVDVTKVVENKKNKSKVHNARVVEVKTYDFWVLGKSVTFVLDYTDPEAKKERDDKAAKEERAKKAAKKLDACSGNTAWEVKILAEDAGYGVSFVDRYDIDVTKSVVDGGKESDAGKAKVTDAEVSKPMLFFSGSVRAKIDYVDPDAAQEREEAKLREENREAIQAAVGRSAGKTQELVDSSGFDLIIEDDYGTDITEKVRGAKKGSPIRRAGVASVKIDDEKSRPCVTLRVDYLDFSSVKAACEANGHPAEITFSDISVTVDDDDPTSSSSYFSVIAHGTITSNDSWDVDSYYLPALGTPSESLYKCVGIELDNGKDELAAGESCGFTYSCRLSCHDPRVTLRAHDEGVVMHNAEKLLDEIYSRLEAVDRAHFESYRQYQEEQQRIREQQRKNATCYYTASGSCYHAYTSCPTLSRSRNIYETTVAQAESWGLEPCDRCH